MPFGLGSKVKVTVVLHQIVNLNHERLDKVDPYVIMSVHGKEQKSTCKKNEENPVYEETFVWEGAELGPIHHHLEIQIKDKDIGRDDKIGWYKVDLKKDVKPGEMKRFEVTVDHHGIFKKAVCHFSVLVE
eukprot:NODE_9655_length_632_cov_168.787819_g9389_i0.p1 GENE.NODE_9655_length_632_cov_168.787819_g9389_i0~~NODE_9655_length_632_cov_168.787819_g9389_i0.p1  ORF type:complete len:130 (-),score=32.56 NODE_9655_length_632_cov_168.787819_g9389_i0:182-571(-)